MNRNSQNFDNATVNALRRERDELLDLLRKLVHGNVGQTTLWKLSEGQGTETPEGKAWLAAKAVVDRPIAGDAT